jgi:hypothetical protein
VANSKTETRVFPGAYDNVFRAVCDAARMSTMTIMMADPATGLVQLNSDISLASWGERVAVQLRPGPSEVHVSITSSLQFGLVDWGRNGKNIGTLFDLIASALANPTPPAGAWHPDPAGRHETRWWDGTRWTEHVSDGGRVSVDHV